MAKKKMALARFNQSLASAEFGYAPGHEYQIDEAWAKQLEKGGIVKIIENGIAVDVPDEVQVETPEGGAARETADGKPETPENPPSNAEDSPAIDRMNADELLELAVDREIDLPDGEITIEDLRELVRAGLEAAGTVDLQSLNADELRAHAADLGLEVPQKVKSKKELVAFITEKTAVTQ